MYRKLSIFQACEVTEVIRRCVTYEGVGLGRSDLRTVLKRFGYDPKF